MLRVGITGGIGSGKSTVCSIFSRLGVPVYYADERARMLMNANPIRRKLIDAFGMESYLASGELNRAWLSTTVFSDSNKLEILNSIVHPVVFADFEIWCDEHRSFPYVIKEAAIMFETESRNTVNTIVLVYAPKALRLKRVMARDNMSEAEVLKRMDRQMPEEEKLKLANHVIYNDGEHMLTEQVLALHKLFMRGIR